MRDDDNTHILFHSSIDTRLSYVDLRGASSRPIVGHADKFEYPRDTFLAEIHTFFIISGGNTFDMSRECELLVSFSSRIIAFFSLSISINTSYKNLKRFEPEFDPIPYGWRLCTTFEPTTKSMLRLQLLLFGDGV